MSASSTGSVLVEDFLTDSIVASPAQPLAPYADLYGTLTGETGNRPTVPAKQNSDLLDLEAWETTPPVTPPSATSPSNGGAAVAGQGALPAGGGQGDGGGGDEVSDVAEGTGGSPPDRGSLANPMGQAIDMLGGLT